MTKDPNQVQLTGHLGTDPEMRYTAHGSPRTTFREASNRTWRDSDGPPRSNRMVPHRGVGYIGWTCHTDLAKGTCVDREGRPQTRKWTDRDGHTRSTTEGIAQDMMILPG